MFSIRHRAVDSHSNSLCETVIDDNYNRSEKNTESPQGERSVKPNTNPTENTQQNVLQPPDSSLSEIHTGQIKNIAVEMQKQFSEAFWSEDTQP